MAQSDGSLSGQIVRQRRFFTHQDDRDTPVRRHIGVVRKKQIGVGLPPTISMFSRNAFRIQNLADGIGAIVSPQRLYPGFGGTLLDAVWPTVESRYGIALSCGAIFWINFRVRLKGSFAASGNI